MKKNIIIIVLTIIVLGLLTYIIFNKNTKNTEIETSKTKEEKIEMSEAKALVDKYVPLIAFGDGYKIFIAYLNVDNNKFDTVGNCEEYGGVEIGCSSVNTEEISYEELNKTYQYLFGENTALSRTSYYVGSMDLNYNRVRMSPILYSPISDKFIMPDLLSTGFGPSYAYEVDNAEIKNEKLIIDVLHSFTDSGPTLATFKSPYTQNVYEYGEEQEFINNERENFDSYQFILEKENNHYIFDKIIKIET